jgi:hypothetical protein
MCTVYPGEDANVLPSCPHMAALVMYPEPVIDEIYTSQPLMTACLSDSEINLSHAA